MPASKYNQFKKAPTLKSKIRSFKRYLRKKGLTEEQKQHFTELLQECEQQLRDKEEEKLEKSLIPKNKKYKHFDLLRVTRHLRKLQNKCENPTETLAEIEEWKRRKEYVIYYPASEKYYSLFPTKQPSDEQLEKQQKFFAITHKIAEYALTIKPTHFYYQTTHQDRVNAYLKALELEKKEIEDENVEEEEDDDEDNGEEEEEEQKDQDDEDDFFLVDEESNEKNKFTNELPSKNKNKSKKGRENVKYQSTVYKVNSNKKGKHLTFDDDE